MMLLIGKSDLGRAIAARFGSSRCVMVGRPEYDFALKQDCDRLLQDHTSPDIVINTMGVMTDDRWNSMLINYVAPVYITMGYVERLQQGHIINVGSASSWWPSWPGVDMTRLSYNIGKQSLAVFNQHINRVKIDDTKTVTVSLVEPGRFKSRMSDHQGMEIDRVVDGIEHVIESRCHHLSLLK